MRTIDPKKLTALKRRLRIKPQVPASKQKLVQKNLSLPENDAARLKALSKRDGLTQAGVLIAALDAYETLYGKL